MAGYAGTTLVDQHVVEYRNREDTRNGIDLDAQAHLDSHKKRFSAGLVLASAGTHSLGPNVLASAMVRKRNAEELVTERQNKRQHEIMKFRNQFMALCAANKPEHILY